MQPQPLGDGQVHLSELALGDAALKRDRALDRVHRAGELDQGAVAHQLDHAAVVFRDQRLGELLAQRPQAGDGAGLVGAHEATVADGIRGQNRRQLAFRTRGHGGTLRIYRRNRRRRDPTAVARRGRPDTAAPFGKRNGGWVDQQFYPSREHLRWHHAQVFQGQM